MHAKDQCQLCTFFKKTKQVGDYAVEEVKIYGECHRHAPQPIVNSNQYVADTDWPSVSGEDFCGEFRSRN